MCRRASSSSGWSGNTWSTSASTSTWTAWTAPPWTSKPTPTTGWSRSARLAASSSTSPRSWWWSCSATRLAGPAKTSPAPTSWPRSASASSAVAPIRWFWAGVGVGDGIPSSSCPAASRATGSSQSTYVTTGAWTVSHTTASATVDVWWSRSRCWPSWVAAIAVSSRPPMVRAPRRRQSSATLSTASERKTALPTFMWTSVSSTGTWRACAWWETVM